MADPRLPVQNIDIPSLWMAIQQSRAANSRAGLEQAQLAQVYAEQQRAAQMQRALAAGDIQAASEIDPEAALDYQGKMLAQQAAAQGLEGDKRKATDEFMRSAANALRANPQAAELVARTRDARVKAGQIEHFEIPGWDLAPDVAGPPGGEPSAQQAATLGALGGAKLDAERSTPSIVEWEYAQGNPAFAEAMRASGGGEAGKLAREQAEKLLDNEMKFAKEVRADKAIEALRTSEAAYARATSAMDNAAGDAVMLMGLAQLMLPGEAINEGDVGRLQARGVPGRVVAAIQSAKENRALLPEERAGFRAQIEALRKRNMLSAAPYVQAFRRQAKEFGFDVNRVMPGEIFGAIRSYDDADAEYDKLRGGQ